MLQKVQKYLFSCGLWTVSFIHEHYVCQVYKISITFLDYTFVALARLVLWTPSEYIFIKNFIKNLQ